MGLPKTTRRAFCAGLGVTTALMHPAMSAEQGTRGPLLWLVSKGRARVYLFPFGEARDDSWLTPTVRQAFEESTQLWIELGKPLSPERQAELYRELGQDSTRSFFDALEPDVKARALRYMDELQISRESVQSQRPWLAYYTFVKAFGQKHGRSQGLTAAAPPQLPPDFVLVDRALKAGKAIHTELTMEEWLRKLAALPDRLQNDYLEWLFDYFDDQKVGGRAEERFGWMHGKPSARSNERMRTKLPDLYEVMDTQRNEWWVRKIVELLNGNATSFIAIGQNHVLGPVGIPQLLTADRLGGGMLTLL
jgi:uncharacterized protein YbaP (TraB family)